MATKYYVGTVQAVPQVDKLTISAVASAAVLTATVNGKSVTYTCTSSDTTSTAASAFLSLWQRSGDGEIRELTAAIDPASSAALLITGPNDGAPFTLTASGSGGGTITRSSVTSPKSPHDASDTGNYSGGSLPSAGDDLIFQTGSRGPKYNLTALSAIALANVKRYASFTGTIGLPTQNPRGYLEYRGQYLQIDATNFYADQNSNDVSQAIRIQSVGSTLAVTVSGSTKSTASNPQLEVYGLASTSSVNIAGGSIGIANQAGQTATAATLNASNSAVFTGLGASFTATILTECSGTLGGSWSTCRVAGESNLTCALSAGSTLGSGVGLTIDGGILNWRSPNSPAPIVEVANGATLDLTYAPSVMTAFQLNLYQGATVNDPAGRIGTPHTVLYVQCDPSQVTYVDQPGRSHVVS